MLTVLPDDDRKDECHSSPDSHDPLSHEVDVLPREPCSLLGNGTSERGGSGLRQPPADDSACEQDRTHSCDPRGKGHHERVAEVVGLLCWDRSPGPHWLGQIPLNAVTPRTMASARSVRPTDKETDQAQEEDREPH